MALTSVAGASLTKGQTGGAGFPVPVSFTSPSYNGWIKVPSLGVDRVLFDHDGRLAVHLDATGKFALYLDGALAATGASVHPTNAWIFWALKKSVAAPNYLLRTCILDCIAGVPTLTALSTEISHSQAVAAGNPAQFTLHIPSGCAVCNFWYGNSSTNLTTARTAWGTLVLSSNLIWRCPLRFPNDLHDHREITASSGDTSFHGMHEWDSQSGVITLHAGGDPEHLRHLTCEAILGVTPFAVTLDPGMIGANTEVILESTTIPFTFFTDVLPATAIMSSISLDGYATATQPPGSPWIFPDLGSRWKFPGSASEFDYFTSHGVSGFINYWVWQSQWSGPNPNINHPVTGLPWTLADLYAATFKVLGRWDNDPGGGPVNRIILASVEVGILVIYEGQSDPASCGDLPPGTGAIIVTKVVIE